MAAFGILESSFISKKVVKKMRRVLIVAASLSAALLPPNVAGAATLSGTLTLTIKGSLSVAGTGGTGVNCKAQVVLVPSNGGTVILGSSSPFAWLGGAIAEAKAHAGLPFNGITTSTAGSSVTGTAPTANTNTTYGGYTSAGTVTGFTCVVTVPYYFPNAGAANTQDLAVMYKVDVFDSGFTVTHNPTVSGAPPTYTFTVPSHPPSSTRQTVQIAAPPTATGGAITLTVPATGTISM